MAGSLKTRIGSVDLKNPVICGSGEHVMTEAGIRAAIATGAGAVVAKSFNETEAGKDQLDHTDYRLLDSNWRELPWDFGPPRDATLACRSELTRTPFEDWLAVVAGLDGEAREQESYVVASVILAALDPAVDMARRIEQAGVRILEFNIGTPYGDEAAGTVSTERAADNVHRFVAAVCNAVTIPVWVKITGQSDSVAGLAEAAGDAGADAVVMMGRFLGMVPDLDTQAPLLGTNLGVGGAWSLPLTCYWLSQTRRRIGDKAPLIGTNGARDGLDVVRMMLAGATAVELSSAVFTAGFGVLEDAVATVGDYLRAHDQNAADIIGRAADRVGRFTDQPVRRDYWRDFIPGEAK